MSFKQFLAEMPYIIPVDQVKSPEGDTIDPYDMGLEDVTIVSKEKRDELAKQVMQKRGIVPMYNKKNNKFFLYDYDTKKSWYPEEDITKINILLNGMYKNAKGRGNDELLAKRLKTTNLPWKKPSKAFK